MKTKFAMVFAAGLAAAACASTANQGAVDPNASSGITSTAIPGSEQDFVEQTGERVFFELDSYALRSDGRAALERQAAWLQQYPDVEVLVAGNCDERGTREYNLALGARRANAARDYLVSLGVSPSRITTISYGKERPLDPRSNEEAWALNRNAHTQIVSGAVS